MTDRILVVCTANVCRSPTTALLLQRGLDRARVGSLIELRTAGTSVSPFSGYCPTVAEVIGPTAGGLLARHRSRPLDHDAVEAADLVMVMEREHRGRVVTITPSASAKTFTVREAAALAGALRQRRGRRHGPAALTETRDGMLDLPGFVRAMHDARGSTGPTEHRRSLAERMGRAAPVDPLDVPDAHVRRLTRHPTVVQLLTDGVDGLLAGLIAGTR